MSSADQRKNTAQDVTGKAKEAPGKHRKGRTGHHGKVGQTEADAKKAGENVKDVFKN
jgi:uncharacterized protein YjbJ (UPF0337 family)